MKDLNIGGDCKSKNLETAADTMDDIANIIEEVGIDKLGEDLGISKTSFNFNFIWENLRKLTWNGILKNWKNNTSTDLIDIQHTQQLLE